MNAHNELMTMAREYGWTQESVEAVMSHDARKLTKDGVEVLMEFTKAGVLQFISVKTYGQAGSEAPKRLQGKTYGTSYYVGNRDTPNKRRVAWTILRAVDPVAAAKRENAAKYDHPFRS
jgi:hypothetical protein